jgi:hypothetical protein
VSGLGSTTQLYGRAMARAIQARTHTTAHAARVFGREHDIDVSTESACLVAKCQCVTSLDMLAPHARHFAGALPGEQKRSTCNGRLRPTSSLNHTKVLTPTRQAGGQITKRVWVPLGTKDFMALEVREALAARRGTHSCKAPLVVHARSRYAKVWTITGPASAVAGPASNGPRFCSIHAIARLFDSSAPA